MTGTFITLTALVILSADPAATSEPNLSSIEIENTLESANFLLADPPELQYGCAVRFDPTQSRLAEQLADANQKFADRLAAAQKLWRGQSRCHAEVIIVFIASPLPKDADRASLVAFQDAIQADLQPQAILRELKEGTYPWGAWLAFLRPHKDFVPVLLRNLEVKDEYLFETMIALGATRAPQALNPLLTLLESETRRAAGYAADALGYLGNPQANPVLIKALADGNNWRQVNACGALAKIGDVEAIPALESLAKSKKNYGALNVQGMAEFAIESIRKRHPSNP